MKQVHFSFLKTFYILSPPLCLVILLQLFPLNIHAQNCPAIQDNSGVTYNGNITDRIANILFVPSIEYNENYNGNPVGKICLSEIHTGIVGIADDSDDRAFINLDFVIRNSNNLEVFRESKLLRYRVGDEDTTGEKFPWEALHPPIELDGFCLINSSGDYTLNIEFVGSYYLGLETTWTGNLSFPDDNGIIEWGSTFFNNEFPAIDNFIPVAEGENDPTPTEIVLANLLNVGTVNIEEPNLADELVLCGGESATLDAGNSSNYLWSTGETTQNILVSTSDTYSVTVSDLNCIFSDAIVVTTSDFPTADLGFENDIESVDYCEDATPIIIELIDIDNTDTYIWSSGDITSSISINAPGTYTVSVVNSVGCIATDFVTINLEDGIMVNLGSDIDACEGDNILLQASIAKALITSDDYTYMWSTGNTTETIVVTQDGTYTLTVTNADVCMDIDEINVTFHDYPVVDLGTNQFICDASSTILDATVNPQTSYQWSTGATTSTIEVTEEGNYQVSVTTNGCTTVDNVNVFFGDATADIQLTVEDCNTGNTTLSTEENPNFTYLWNTGSTQSSIDVTQAGTYSVRVTEDNCSVVDEIIVSSESIGTQTAYTLTTDEVWTNQRNILGEMIVPLGRVLTIDGATIHFMDEHSGILVEEGGVLEVINGAVLRGSYCSADFWRGIIAAGDVNAEHPTTYLTQGSSNHGIVVIEGESTIRDATIGIQTGNGIIRAVDANFIDNVVGISIGILGGIIDLGFSAETQHVIEGNNFGIEAPIIVSQTLPQYGGIQLFNVMDPIFIDNINIFYNNDPNLIVQGIGNVNSIILCQDNIFNDLHTGINLSSTSNVSLNLIYDNIFNNTEKGIMAVGGIGPAIKRNQFNNIPMGTHSVDTYGAFCINNRPTIIDNNTFETLVSNNETKGLVIANTSDFVHIADNSFDGAFGAGTQFQGGNTNVLLECNSYTSAPKVDWYIAGNSSLNNQGDCEGFEEAPFALNNNWHAESTGYHIFRYNSNNGNLSIDHDPCSEPTLTSPNVINTPCGFISEVACCAGANVEENPDDRVTISQNLNQLLEQGNQQGAINLLTQQQAEWADRLLVGTYFSLGDKTSATTALGRIPQNTPYNVAFHDMFNALINANPQLSMFDEQMIRTYGQSTDLAIQSVAHSILASYFGENFTYTSAAVITSSNKRANPTFDESIVFSLNPNPSIYQLDINLNTSITNEKIIFTVYNVTGKIMQSINLTEQTTSLDIVDLATGIYYCQVNFNDKVSEVQKLVIVR